MHEGNYLAENVAVPYACVLLGTTSPMISNANSTDYDA